jgi:lysophospholipase L1-like esterase
MPDPYTLSLEGSTIDEILNKANNSDITVSQLLIYLKGLTTLPSIDLVYTTSGRSMLGDSPTRQWKRATGVHTDNGGTIRTISGNDYIAMLDWDGDVRDFDNISDATTYAQGTPPAKNVTGISNQGLYNNYTPAATDTNAVEDNIAVTDENGNSVSSIYPISVINEKADTNLNNANEGSVRYDLLTPELKSAIAGSLDPENYLGAITSLTADFADPTANTGKWAFIDGISGTFTGANAPTGTAEDGGYVFSDGTNWLLRGATPVYLLANQVTFEKLAQDVQRRFENITNPDIFWSVVDQDGFAPLYIKSNGVVYANLPINTTVANGLSVTQNKLTGQITANFGTVEGTIPVGDIEVSEAGSTSLFAQYAFVVHDNQNFVAFAVKKNGDIVNKSYSELLTRVTTAEADITTLESDVTTLQSDVTTLQSDVSTLQSQGVTAAGYTTTLNDYATRLLRMKLGRVAYLGHAEPNGTDDIAKGPIKVCMIGDSYTHGSFRVCQPFRDMMLSTKNGGKGFQNAGAGYLSFAWHSLNSDGSARLPNLSVDTSELDMDIDIANVAKFDLTAGGGHGPDASHIESNTNGATFDIEVKGTPLDSFKLMYVTQTGGGDFTYSVNGGAAVTVSTNATESVSTVNINLSAQTSVPYNITVTCDTNVILLGGVGDKDVTDNNLSGFQLHKCGKSGATGGVFAATDLWKHSFAELDSDATFIMFATNEMGNNFSPTGDYTTWIERIIDNIREVKPMQDIVLMLPTFTKYEWEDPKTYKLGDYRDALISIAHDKSCGFIDFSRIVQPIESTGLTSGVDAQFQLLVDANIMNSDRVHPTHVGGYLMSRAIVDYLYTV